MTLGVLCPGQGDQTPAMFDRLPSDGPAAAVLRLADSILGQELRQIPAERLSQNAVAQPVLCALQMATWAALSARVPRPRIFAGYSVGELSAYGCAGALSAADTINLAVQRAATMDAVSSDPGGLMAVRGLRRPEVEDLCRAYRLEVAIVNALDRFVIGGRVDDLDVGEPALLALGAKVTRLEVTVASHTSRMAPAVASFRQALSACALRDSPIPVLAGIDGSPVTTRTRAIDTLSMQLGRTVEWAACLEGLAETRCTALLELGPSNGLSRMVRDDFPDIAVRSVSEFQSLDGVVAWVERMV